MQSPFLVNIQYRYNLRFSSESYLHVQLLLPVCRVKVFFQYQNWLPPVLWRSSSNTSAHLVKGFLKNVVCEFLLLLSSTGRNAVKILVTITAIINKEECCLNSCRSCLQQRPAIISKYQLQSLLSSRTSYDFKMSNRTTSSRVYNLKHQYWLPTFSTRTSFMMSYSQILIAVSSSIRRDCHVSHQSPSQVSEVIATTSSTSSSSCNYMSHQCLSRIALLPHYRCQMAVHCLFKFQCWLRA
jgi:hypothetical protein